MASPATAAVAALPNGTHPSTPPPFDTATTALQPTQQADPEVPLTSLQDDGQAKRPRDVKLINLVLHSQGIESYQERVPLQLLDFAYRYTSGVLSDSLRLSAEGYAGANAAGGERAAGGRGRGTGGAAGADAAGNEGITTSSLRQAIASRSGHTFAAHLPKEFMLEQAGERNRVGLPKIDRVWGGVQLPPEKYCLTGTAWNLREEWESDDGDDDEVGGGGGMRGVNGYGNGNGHATVMVGGVGRQGGGDERMGGMGVDGAMDRDEEDEDEEGVGRMEDVFGEEGGDVSMGQD